MILLDKQITQVLISLGRSEGWSSPMLFANLRRHVFLRRGPYDIWADQPEHDMSTILSTFLSYSLLVIFQVSKLSLQILYRSTKVVRKTDFLICGPNILSVIKWPAVSDNKKSSQNNLISGK